MHLFGIKPWELDRLTLGELHEMAAFARSYMGRQ